MDLGQRIAAWRKQKRLTQKQLARKIGVVPATVCFWEGAGATRHFPTQENLQKIVKALGLTMERFYGRLPKPRAAA